VGRINPAPGYFSRFGVSRQADRMIASLNQDRRTQADSGVILLFRQERVHRAFEQASVQPHLQSFSAGALSSQQEGARKSAEAAQLECSEVLVSSAFGNVRILGLPFRQCEEIFLRDLALLCTIPEMSPLLPRQSFPLNLRHASAAEDQSSELVYELILLLRVIVRKVRLKLFKNSAFLLSCASSPRRTRAAIALLMLVSTVRAYRPT